MTGSITISAHHPKTGKVEKVFTKASVMIGRAAGNDILLEEGEVSRFHAVVLVEDGVIYVQDAGSKNGVFVDGQKVTRKALGEGGHFKLGDYELTVSMASNQDTGAESEAAAAISSATSPVSPPKLTLVEPLVEKPVVVEIAKTQKEVSEGFYWDALKSFLKPIWPHIESETVTEIMVNGPTEIFVEEKGVMRRIPETFGNDELAAAVLNIAQYVGRRVSEEEPYLDARLPDGSRVAILMPPCSRKGTSISIRKFSKEKLTLDKLVGFGSLTEDMVTYLRAVVLLKKNTIVSGGTSSGKTSLLNVVSGLIPDEERIITIEDSAELQLRQIHVLPMETRPADKKGRGQVTIRDLVKASLRMRPDRVVVGEIRGGEALDLLQAMNTGHSGSMATVHASSPTQALSRLETLSLFSGLEIPARALRDQVATAVEVVIQAARLPDHSRKVTNIAEVYPLDNDGRFVTRDIFKFERTGMKDGKIIGSHNLLSETTQFSEEMELAGLTEARALFKK
jgi:pilus assembly protein CpaF